ncbi:MAG: hypothetical protein PHT51_02545 [Patescibacteria group bacterium]|nr:hypothetical protein [Patescibacteria group bacterium]
MFDDLTQKPNQPIAAANTSAPGVMPAKPANPPVPQSKVEDIYAGTDKTVVGAINKNIPRPAVFIPKAPTPNITDIEEDGAKSQDRGKKLFVLLGIFFGIFIILGGGYLVFAKFMKSTTTPVVSQLPIATTTSETTPEVPIQSNTLATTSTSTSETTSQVTAIETAIPSEDNDSDGLPNEEEKKYGTNLNLADSDEDGLSDRDEVRIYSTDPLNPDTDGDGIVDGEEVKNGYNPKGTGRLFNLPSQTAPSGQTPKSPDTDKDGLTDVEEAQYKTDVLNSDTDKDGLTDGDEVKVYKTNPLNSDTDGDSFLDGVEVKNGFNPLGAGKLGQ